MISPGDDDLQQRPAVVEKEGLTTANLLLFGDDGRER
jgi:hypothetical protein